MDTSLILFADSNGLNNFGETKEIKLNNYYPGASARGLNNSNSLLKTREKIIEKVESHKSEDNHFLFYFGKVDIDFITNHKYNTNPDLDLEHYISECALSYVNFILSLNIKNTWICE